MKFVSADIYRDGGSYEVIVESPEGLVTMWLQVSNWDHPNDKEYENLFVVQGGDSIKRKVAIGSEEEMNWAKNLMAVEKLESSDSFGWPRFEEFLKILIEMVERNAT